ncbi:hypothetical protein [Maribacter litoralis]|nr:hypothetical protein [Maribacter litoralis]
MVITNKSKKYNIQEFENYPYLVKKIKQISLHKLGTFISSGTNNILIFSFISAQMVTFFGNYNLIISNADLLVTKLFSGTKASVGNLVAENDSEKNNQVFWEFMSLRFYIGGLGFIGIITLMDPFIQVWLGEKYVLSISVSIVFAINFLLGQIRQPVDVFKQGFGLYADTWAPVTQGTINLIISFALAKPLGLTGILLGNTISLLIIVMIWRPYYLYKKGFKVQIGSYIIGFFKHLTLLCVFLFITNFIINLFPFKVKNFTDVGIKVVIVTPLSATIYGLILYTTNQHFRDVIKRLYSGFVNR